MDTVFLMGTGPRDWNPSYYPQFKNDLETFVSIMRTHHDQEVNVISGGAQGFDIALAHAAKALSIPYGVILPNPTYVDYYYRGKGHRTNCLGSAETMDLILASAGWIQYASKTLYVERGDRSVHSNFVRNDLMVAKADLCVAGFDRSGVVPNTGGTGHAVRAAFAAGLDVYNQEFVLGNRPMPALNTTNEGVNF